MEVSVADSMPRCAATAAADQAWAERRSHMVHRIPAPPYVLSLCVPADMFVWHVPYASWTHIRWSGCEGPCLQLHGSIDEPCMLCLHWSGYVGTGWSQAGGCSDLGALARCTAQYSVLHRSSPLQHRSQLVVLSGYNHELCVGGFSIPMEMNASTQSQQRENRVPGLGGISLFERSGGTSYHGLVPLHWR